MEQLRRARGLFVTANRTGLLAEDAAFLADALSAVGAAPALQLAACEAAWRRLSYGEQLLADVVDRMAAGLFQVARGATPPLLVTALLAMELLFKKNAPRTARFAAATGIMPTLLALVGSHTRDVCVSIAALRLLGVVIDPSSDPRSLICEALVDAGVFPYLVSLLNTHAGVIHATYLVAGCMQNLATGSEVRKNAAVAAGAAAALTNGLEGSFRAFPRFLAGNDSMPKASMSDGGFFLPLSIPFVEGYDSPVDVAIDQLSSAIACLASGSTLGGKEPTHPGYDFGPCNARKARLVVVMPSLVRAFRFCSVLMGVRLALRNMAAGSVEVVLRTSVEVLEDDAFVLMEAVFPDIPELAEAAIGMARAAGERGAPRAGAGGTRHRHRRNRR